ncbi:MAG: hypothetical protein M3R24_10545 [Chloroflexota bacterium]|nr:hypothetical protein [Chloroflexota bacterium]PLS78106.1 MAG: hypothetical protein CYG59_20330 [Chloroflexota bacterium]
MKYDPERHHRRSIRLRGYDYSQAGAYFVTLCVQSREWLLGDVVDGRVVLSEAGAIVWRVWEELPRRFPMVELDAFVVMPNHVHGVIVIDGMPAQVVAGAASSARTGSEGIPGSAGTGGTDKHWVMGPDGLVDVGAPLAAPLRNASQPRAPQHNASQPRAPEGSTLQPPASQPEGPRPHVFPAHKEQLETDGIPPPTPSLIICQPQAIAAAASPTLGEIMRAFKSISAIQINRVLGRSGQPFWQRDYFERIVRHEKELDRIRTYIDQNPLRWQQDREQLPPDKRRT